MYNSKLSLADPWTQALFLAPKHFRYSTPEEWGKPKGLLFPNERERPQVTVMLCQCQREIIYWRISTEVWHQHIPHKT